MIKIENTEVLGWDAAIRGMRNPLNSWAKSDSEYATCGIESTEEPQTVEFDKFDFSYKIGPNDHNLMIRLCDAGEEHRKFMRMIVVYTDILAPLYWWKEFDTYKIGTVANSCSTMHKIAAKEFTLEDFSHEHLENFLMPGDYYELCLTQLKDTIDVINNMREAYLKTKDKRYWWQMIQLLPSSYNQRRTVMLNYEVLYKIYNQREGHKLDEWHEFRKWIKNLPYSELITG